MKITEATAYSFLCTCLLLGAARIAMGSNSLCPDIIRTNCGACATIPNKPAPFFCCSSGVTPGGNPMCCQYDCMEYKCVPTIKGTELCTLIPPETNAQNGTPHSPFSCVQYPTYQACVEQP